MPTIYDPELDQFREATQEDIDRMWRIVQEYGKLKRERAVNDDKIGGSP